MKKLLLSAVVILGSVGYVFFVRGAQSASPAPEISPVTASVQTSGDATPVTVAPVKTTPTPTPTPTVVPPTPAAPSGQYKNGTYTGSVTDAYYGNIQVAAVIAGGKLSNVKVLQFPNDRGTSIEINQQALPMLIQEAISAQSSNVDGISGATDTSAAFIESLHAALVKAKA